MRFRWHLGHATALVTAVLVLSACATGRAPPPPPPPPPLPAGVLHGDAAGVVVQNAKPPPAAPANARGGKRIKGGLIDPSCRYCVTDDPAKRQYFDQRRNRYYYFDRTRKAYFWENGEPKV